MHSCNNCYSEVWIILDLVDGVCNYDLVGRFSGRNTHLHPSILGINYIQIEKFMGRSLSEKP